MKPIQSFTLEEYYPWRRKIDAQYPWQRKFVDGEFLKHEQKRIRKCREWSKKFLKTEFGKHLDIGSFYVVPVEGLSSSWKAAIADFGNYMYFGLSVLTNSPLIIAIALLPYTENRPLDYKLIEITKSRRVNIINKRLNMVEPVILIEGWNYLKSDSIYKDVPYEKKSVQKIISENFIDNRQISLSFQSPIISAPYVNGSFGGISLSSIAYDSVFAKELLKTMQLLVPPEYRTLKPPKSVYKGYMFPYLEGIGFHLAERPYWDSNIFSTLYAKEYPVLEAEQLQRYRFGGEFSILSTLSPDEGNLTQMWKELMKNFTATEIALPASIEELKGWLDVDLRRLKRAANEDIWIQVAYARHCMPGMSEDADKDYIKTVNLLKEDFDTLLSDIIKQADSREYLISSMLYPSSYNLKRIAQSIARSEEKDLLDHKHFKEARDLIVDNFTGFINHPEFRSIKSRMEGKKEDARYSVVQTEIINHPHSSTKEIFDAVKTTKLFKDTCDLQGLLDWLQNKSLVIVDSYKRYVWSGLHYS